MLLCNAHDVVSSNIFSCDMLQLPTASPAAPSPTTSPPTSNPTLSPSESPITKQVCFHLFVLLCSLASQPLFLLQYSNSHYRDRHGASHTSQPSTSPTRVPSSLPPTDQPSKVSLCQISWMLHFNNPLWSTNVTSACEMLQLPSDAPTTLSPTTLPPTSNPTPSPSVSRNTEQVCFVLSNISCRRSTTLISSFVLTFCSMYYVVTLMRKPSSLPTRAPTSPPPTDQPSKVREYQETAC